ncbi:hypothetical protein GGR55DRAFT_498150 [Xylaria sp. FL0064]|nr:hypothetical protein GGR55DRAFT_498150 [Xylaria sp. FL0064]
MTQKVTEQMEYRARAAMMRNGALAKSYVGQDSSEDGLFWGDDRAEGTGDHTLFRNVVSATYEDAGDWLVDFFTDADGARHSMILYHCGFAVSRGQGTPRDAKFSLVNQDILDLYDESLNRFGSLHNGISAEGTMLCDDLEINWYIQDLNA